MSAPFIFFVLVSTSATVHAFVGTRTGIRSTTTNLIGHGGVVRHISPRGPCRHPQRRTTFLRMLSMYDDVGGLHEMIASSSASTGSAAATTLTTTITMPPAAGIAQTILPDPITTISGTPPSIHLLDTTTTMGSSGGGVVGGGSSIDFLGDASLLLSSSSILVDTAASSAITDTTTTTTTTAATTATTTVSGIPPSLSLLDSTIPSTQHAFDTMATTTTVGLGVGGGSEVVSSDAVSTVASTSISSLLLSSTSPVSTMVIAESPQWLQPTSTILDVFLNFMSLAMLMRIVLSWYPTQNVKDVPWIFAVLPTEPLLRASRGVIPPAFGVDVTPVAWLGFFTLVHELALGPQGLLTLKMKYGI